MTGRTEVVSAERDDRPLEIVDVRPSECGYQALLWALREAERRDATVLAVAIWAGDPTDADGGRAAMEEAVTALVWRAVEETGVHGRTRVAVVSSPLTAYEVAAELGAELVVVGAEEAGDRVPGAAAAKALRGWNGEPGPGTAHRAPASSSRRGVARPVTRAAPEPVVRSARRDEEESMTTAQACSRHGEQHEHRHGPSCGHEAVEHEGHVDYVHDGHRHAEHEGHYDEH